MELKSNRRGIKLGIVATLLRSLLIFIGANAGAQTLVSVTLAWNPSAASDIAGYYLYQGTASGHYTQRTNAGNLLSAVAPGLTPGLTYYFAVSAHDTNGLESTLSTEVSYTPPLSATYYGINLTDPTQALADSDGDGLPNLVEYAVGANPLDSTDANAGTHILLTQAGNKHYLAMQYKSRANAGALPLQYLPEVSADKITWYSDSNHVVVVGVTPLDSEFNLVTVQDTTPITPTASQYLRLRISSGTLQSASPTWIGSDTLLHGNNLTVFSQCMVRPILCAGTVTTFSGSSLVDTNAAFFSGQFGTNGTPAFVELDNGAMMDIEASGSNMLEVASSSAETAAAGNSYRIRAQFTVASLFGTNDETGLTSGSTPAQADNILLYDAKSQSTLTLFYYSNPTLTPWQGWVRADTFSAAGNQVVHPEEGIIVRRIVPNDAQLYLCGPIKTSPTQVMVQPGYNLLGTLNNSSGFTLSALNLFTGDSLTGLTGGLNPSASDNVVVVNSDGSTATFFYYYNPGVASGWVNAKGFTLSDSVLIPPGSAFFINRQTPAAFTWTIPAD